jgi:Sulfotransferase family
VRADKADIPAGGSSGAKEKRRAKRPPSAKRDPVSRELERVARVRQANLVLVDQPLVLISQAPRSGGTLLMRLLDGHPECHSIPHELGISFGPPGRLIESRDRAWSTLWFKSLQSYFVEGFRGAPFLLPPRFHRRLFDARLDALAEPTERDVLDAWMTGYFNAWLDNQNYHGPRKRWITGFSPRLVAERAMLDRFFDLYPDGKLISIVREPKGWYSSARHYSSEWIRLERALAYWRSSLAAVLEAKERLGDRHRILLFSDFLTDTRGTMRLVTDFLGIGLVPQALTPTVNGRPMTPNSSFKLKTTGVSKAPLEQYKTVLSDSEMAVLDEQGGGLLAAAVQAASRPRQVADSPGASGST